MYFHFSFKAQQELCTHYSHKPFGGFLADAMRTLGVGGWEAAGRVTFIWERVCADPIVIKTGHVFTQRSVTFIDQSPVKMNALTSQSALLYLSCCFFNV